MVTVHRTLNFQMSPEVTTGLVLALWTHNTINKNMDTSNQVNESLRDWFGKSKSKDGKQVGFKLMDLPVPMKKEKLKLLNVFHLKD